ncbi:conserved hypothetical protein [Burkholderia latens]
MTAMDPGPASDVAGRHVPVGAGRLVVPLPRPSRLQMSVTLTADAGLRAPARLAALLHSPLDVYVACAHVVRDSVHVQFDIAPQDLGFTLHTLIAQQAGALIGRVACASASGPQRISDEAR